MMGGSWMGSHFSNDDLVKQSRMSEDYTATLTSKPTPEAPQTNWVIELVPKPEAPVVWGKVMVHHPARPRAHRDRLLRREGSSRAHDGVHRHPGDRQAQGADDDDAHPADKPGEFTQIKYAELEFDVELSEKSFTLQALKQ
jgi:hypothetical protein